MKKISKSKLFFILASLVLVVYFFASIPHTATPESKAIEGNWIDPNVTVTKSLSPVGETDTIYISSAEDLGKMLQLTNSGTKYNDKGYNEMTYVLTNNINIGAHYWTPIKEFAGTFDGNGFKIEGMMISYTAKVSASGTGFIASLTGEIKNVSFVDCGIYQNCISGRYIGFVAGMASSTANIENCNVVFTNNNTINNILMFKKLPDDADAKWLWFGGIVGYINGSTIKGCFVDNRTSNAKNDFDLSFFLNKDLSSNLIWCGIGGIVGESYRESSILLCYSKVNITGINKVNEACVGGIIGKMNGGEIDKCYNTANLTIGNIDASSVMAAYVGGIAGTIKNNTKINNSFNSGVISGDTNTAQPKAHFQIELNSKTISSNDMRGNFTFDNDVYRYFPVEFTYSLSGGYYVGDNACYLDLTSNAFSSLRISFETNSSSTNRKIQSINNISYDTYRGSAISYTGTYINSNGDFKNRTFYDGELCFKGGIVGFCESGSLNYCYNIGEISDNNNDAQFVLEHFIKIFNVANASRNIKFSFNTTDKYFINNYAPNGIWVDSISFNIPVSAQANSIICQKLIKSIDVTGGIIGSSLENNNINECYTLSGKASQVENKTFTTKAIKYSAGTQKNSSEKMEYNLTQNGTYNFQFKSSVGQIYAYLNNINICQGFYGETKSEMEIKKLSNMSGWWLSWVQDANINDGFPMPSSHFWKHSFKMLEWNLNYDKNTAVLSRVHIGKDVHIIEIPQSILVDGKTYTVNEIGEQAFMDIETIVEVKLPSSVSIIGKQSFRGCNNLTTINLSEVSTLKWECFSGCSKLQSVNLNDVTVIEGSVFWGCVGLTKIDIPSIREIGDYAFAYCDNLYIIKIAGNLKRLGKKVFYNSTALTEIEYDNYLDNWKVLNKNNYAEIEDWVFIFCKDFATYYVDGVLQ